MFIFGIFVESYSTFLLLKKKHGTIHALPLTWTVNSLILAFVRERLIYIMSDKTIRPI